MHDLSPPVGSRPALVLVSAGLAGGLIDGAYASARGMVESGSVVPVWQTVASGWIGPPAFERGLSAAALGLGTHFGIAIVMAAAWMAADRRLRLAGPARYAGAALYGVGLYLLMYLVVLPLRWPSAFPQWHGWGSILDVAAHVASRGRSPG